MTKNYPIKVAIASALIVIFRQSTLPQHNDHHVLQERTMNINEKSRI